MARQSSLGQLKEEIDRRHEKLKAKMDSKVCQKIIAYAHRRFVKNGIKKTSVEEICAGLALSKRTFYKYFSGREELVNDVVSRIIADYYLLELGLSATYNPTRSTLRNRFELCAELAQKSISFVMMEDIRDLMPDVWSGVENFRRDIIKGTTSFIRHGQKKGDLRKDINPEALSKIINGIEVYLLNPSFAQDNGLTPTQIGQTLDKLLFDGIMAKTKTDK